MPLRARRPASAFLFLTLSIAIPQLWQEPQLAHATTSSFTFAAAGDIGTLHAGPPQASINYLKSVNPDFFIALGDLSYNSSITGRTWCNEFKTQYYHIEIVPGAHDTGEFPPNDTQNGLSTTRSYESFAGGLAPNGAPIPGGCPFTSPGGTLIHPGVCNPLPLCDGREYYFDYPSSNPFARFILISPGVFNITGACSVRNSPPCTIAPPPTTPTLACNRLSQADQFKYDCWPYSVGDIHYDWVDATINEARTNGIEWIIVGMHKPCISAGKEPCSIGPDIFNLLLSRKVDLILQGNDHAYERSYPLALQASCSSIPYLYQPLVTRYINQSSTFVAYNPSCKVQNYGSDRVYLPHQGTTVIIQGTMGGGWNEVNEDDHVAANDTAPERDYFVKIMGRNSPGTGHGFVKYTLSPERIDVETVFTGTLQDKFSITRLPVPSFSWTLHNVSDFTFDGNAAGGLPPYSFNWDFGDGAKESGNVTDHNFTQPAQYSVTLTVIDRTQAIGVTAQTIAVGSWNPQVNCTPAQTSIENVLGGIAVQRDATNPNSKGSDYSGSPSFWLDGPHSLNSSFTTWPFSKRAVNILPPCRANGLATFVELHNVAVGPVGRPSDCSRYYDVYNGGGSDAYNKGQYPNGIQSCVIGFNLQNWNYTTCPTCYLHRIYSTIDRDWNASGKAPYAPLVYDTTRQVTSNAPLQGQRIDVQGFVYWEYSALNKDWHSYSGWELVVTAWRNATQTLLPNNPPAVGPPSPITAYLGIASALVASLVGTATLGKLLLRRRRTTPQD